MAHILICDDEPSIRKTLSEILEDEGFQVKTVDSGEALLSHLHRSDSRVDAILLDVWLPGIDGVETLETLRSRGYRMPVIVISGHATLDLGVKATKLGAFDFLEKPLNLDKVVLTLNNALRQSRLEKRKAQLEASLPQVTMIGESPVMLQLKEDLAMAGASAGRVLILGESGSGKEVAARLLHARSPRASEAFVEMNCAAIPEELIESELFGHVKGSFTGAIENKQGKFEQADGGTLFLDEIADMSLNTQAKVLRVLQEQRFQPLGSTKTLQVDVRVIAATNKDLELEIKEGRFRQDLFFRLSVIPLRMPALNERIEDIELLCQYFIDQFSKEYGRPPIQLEQKALEAMLSYRWPGNVRELRNVIERLMIMSRTLTIQVHQLPAQIRGEEIAPVQLRTYDSLKEARDDFERRYIEYQLRRCEGNITKAAQELKLERSHLHKKIKQYSIET